MTTTTAPAKTKAPKAQPADEAQATQAPTPTDPWEALRAVFPPGTVERLPKVLRADDQDKGRCEQGSRYCADEHPCGGWHARAIHLSYVGHAGVTDRLNSVDPLWTWEPMATTPEGLPLFADGGLWIRLTVLGHSRIGFGDAGSKRGANAVKEIIGDAIRNGAMRFGVGTYLWSKSPDAQVLQAGGEIDQEPAGAPRAPEARTQQQRQDAPRPVHNVQRIHVARQGLTEAQQADLVTMTREQFGPDWTPAKATDEQTDAIVAMADAYRESNQEAPGDSGDQPPT